MKFFIYHKHNIIVKVISFIGIPKSQHFLVYTFIQLLYKRSWWDRHVVSIFFVKPMVFLLLYPLWSIFYAVNGSVVLEMLMHFSSVSYCFCIQSMHFIIPCFIPILLVLCPSVPYIYSLCYPTMDGFGIYY